jgi:hypothetical protein
MKIKLLISLSVLFVTQNFIFSQTAAGKKKPEEKVAAKPPAYDSTKTLEEQFKPENQYQFIGLQLFLPQIINPQSGPIIFSKKGSGLEKGNRNYTIVDILTGDVIKELKQKNLVNLCGSRYKDLNSLLWKEMIIHVVFVLRDNNKDDTLNNAPLYWIVSESKQAPYSSSYFSSFISTPYFAKQNKLYEYQNVIKLDDKSKWVCKKVTFSRSKDSEWQDSAYKISCVLENEKGKEIRLSSPSGKERSFITEKEYNWLDHANRNEKEQMIKEENERREKHKTECISKFGQQNGLLIAQEKVKTGMTTEMCEYAWGKPWEFSKTGTSEVWFYNWKYSLHFEKGMLVKIKH